MTRIFFLWMVSYWSIISAKETIIISLGSACGTASVLSDLKYRMSAYPFDWLISPFDSLCAALEDDFAHFLSDLYPDHGAIIDAYKFQFYHDFPKEGPYESALAEVKEKYERRINRFREACLGTNPVIFIRSEVISKQEAVILRDLLMRKYPLLNFTILAISLDESFKQPWHLYRIRNFFCGTHSHIPWRGYINRASYEMR